MDAAGVIAYYVMDGNRPLTVDSNGNTTSYLYGLGVIGEETNEWNFALPDGGNTPRQLTDAQGDVTLFVRYNPWGGTLETVGTGNFSSGYLGGILDAATNLIYVGNGQYYDPSTGRFLTRNVNPNNANPYVPWNPIGAVVGPLALFVMIASRRKGRHSKANPYLFMLLMLVVLPLSIGMACDGDGTPTPTNEPEQVEQPSTGTPTPGGGSGGGDAPSTPGAPIAPPETPCDDDALTPTPTPTPTPKDIATMPFPGGQAYDEYGAWGKTTQKYKEIRDWMIGNAPGDLEPIPDSSGYGLRFKDSVLLTIIVTIEFRSYSDQRGIFSDLLGALYNQYQSPIFCGGNCDTVEKQLVWLSNKQGMRASSTDWIIRWYPKDRGWGSAVINGEYAGRRGWEWGNYKSNSLFRKNPAKYPHVNYLHREDGGYAGIVVFTAEKNLACRSVDCLGWNR